MRQNCFACSVILGLLMFGASMVFNQNVTKQELAKLFAEIAEDEKTAAECKRAALDAEIRKFGKPLPRPGGHCWDGECPVRLVKPYYPETARRLKVRGDVLISLIFNEDGKVAYASVTKGNPLFHKSALSAAYLSEYPRRMCENKPLKFRRTIKYHFNPEM